MQTLIIIAILGSFGYGFENDWAIAKSFKSYSECREAHPKFVNSMTEWRYDECNFLVYKLNNKED